MIRAHVLICGGTGCTSSGSHDIQKAFAENIESCGLPQCVLIYCTINSSVLQGGGEVLIRNS